MLGGGAARCKSTARPSTAASRRSGWGSFHCGIASRCRPRMPLILSARAEGRTIAMQSRHG